MRALACVVALVSLGCGSRDEVVLMPPDNADAASGDDEDGGEEPGTGNPVLECPLEQGIESLVSSSCPDFGAFGEACGQVGERCVSYRFDNEWLVCSAACSSSRTWRVDCTDDCGHACAEPPDGAVVVVLDTTDCTRRPLTACNAGGLTLQNQLDTHLASFLTDETFMLTDLADDVLVVQFENGCPTRYFGKEHGRALPIVGRMLDAQLARLRLRCAQTLECAEFEGPDR